MIEPVLYDRLGYAEGDEMLFFISLGVDKAIMQNEECQESKATLTFLKAGKNVESNNQLAREKRRRLAIMEIFIFYIERGRAGTTERNSNLKIYILAASGFFSLPALLSTF